MRNTKTSLFLILVSITCAVVGCSSADADAPEVETSGNAGAGGVAQGGSGDSAGQSGVGYGGAAPAVDSGSDGEPSAGGYGGSAGASSTGGSGTGGSSTDGSSTDGSSTGGSSTGGSGTGGSSTDGSSTGGSSTGGSSTGGSSTGGSSTAGSSTGGSSTGGSTGGSSGVPTIWRPAPGTTWQIQLSGNVDTSIEAAVYDVDLVDVPKSVFDELHAKGRKVMCYFSAGSYEEWRPDASKFPAEALGADLDGWPGERWLDVRNAGVRTLMTARMDLAVSKGCDGVDPDNVDGYANGTGFPLTAADQVNYNRFLAQQAHARGLGVGLKNDVGQVAELVGDFDWQVNEECFQYNECGDLAPFPKAGKPVFSIEYGDAALATKVCPSAKQRQFSTLIKKLELGVWRVACD